MNSIVAIGGSEGRHQEGLPHDPAARHAAVLQAVRERLSKHPVRMLPPPPEDARPTRWRLFLGIGLLSIVVGIGVGLATIMPPEIVWGQAEISAPTPERTAIPLPIATAPTLAAVEPAAPVMEPPTVAPPSPEAVAATDPRLEVTATHTIVQSVPERERELTRDEVLEVQTRLRALKFDPGPLDGVKGPLTSAAVSRFQETRGARMTGEVSLDTLMQLRQATARGDQG